MKSLASAAVVSETRDRMLRLCTADKALWGRMTVRQMVQHLSCAYEVALGDRTAEPVKPPIPQAMMKWVALRSGLRWAKGVSTVPELVKALGENPGASFEELVNGTVARMESLAARTECVSSHPIFGGMTVEEWKRWGYLHADHHLRQFGR